MTTSTPISSRYWWLAWLAAFLGFPPGGALATAVIGRLDTPLEGLLGGLLAGAVVGAAQYFALRTRLPVRATWIVATGIGLGVGVALGVLLIGPETTLEATLLRAPIAGLALGIAQWLVLRSQMRGARLWVIAHTLLHPAAWYITAQVIGQNMAIGFVIFGASGALFYQASLGVVLTLLGRHAHAEQ